MRLNQATMEGVRAGNSIRTQVHILPKYWIVEIMHSAISPKTMLCYGIAELWDGNLTHKHGRKQFRSILLQYLLPTTGNVDF